MTASRLTSDQPTRLDPWTARDEADLREAQRKIEAAQARRAIAVNAVIELMVRVGIRNEGPAAAGAEQLIQHADAIRDALAPFDSGLRHGTTR